MNIYIEKQRAKLCAMHTTNSLLGRAYYIPGTYRKKALECVPVKRRCDTEYIKQLWDTDVDVGHYSIWILRKVLERHKIYHFRAPFHISQKKNMHDVIEELTSGMRTKPQRGYILTPGHVAAIHCVKHKNIHTHTHTQTCMWYLADSERANVVPLQDIAVEKIRLKRHTPAKNVTIQFLRSSSYTMHSFP